MRTCPRCGRENEETNRFCGQCGADMQELLAATEVAPAVLEYCYRHPKRPTLLHCGKCGRPICAQCAVLGPAGQRCPECGHVKVKMTARGVAYDAMRPLKMMGRYWYVVLIVLSMALYSFRGCGPSEVIEHHEPGQPGAARQSPPVDSHESDNGGN